MPRRSSAGCHSYRAPSPYVWVKTTDEILSTLARYCERISSAGHQEGGLPTMERLQTRGLRTRAPYDQGGRWANYRLPSTEALGQRDVGVTLDDGRAVAFSFDEKLVRWRAGGEAASESATYDAVAVRPNIYFVQFLHRDNLAATSLILNLNSGGGVLVTNLLIPGHGRTDLQQDLYPCIVTGSNGPFPQLSAELVGKRAYAEYSEDHVAEHLYLNPRRFVWQGLGKFDSFGSECDHATTWKLDDQLFLLTWVEEWEPVGACLLLDYEAMRNVGVLFGQDDNGLVHELCGARLRMLGEIGYPAGYHPAGIG